MDHLQARQIRGGAQASPAGADGTVRMEEGHRRRHVRTARAPPPRRLPRCARRTTEVQMTAAPGSDPRFDARAVAPLATAPPTSSFAPSAGAGIHVDDVSLTF